MKKIILILQLIIAVILLQSLYFKFSGHNQAVHIFSTIKLEPIGRYTIGILELIASVILFIPKTRIIALLICSGLMSGALFFHISTPLGIIVEWNGQTDNGKLFGMGCLVLILSLILLIEHYKTQRPINTLKKLIGF